MKAEEPAQVAAKIDRLATGKGNLKAYANATIDRAFVIHGIRVIAFEKGLYIGMPQESFQRNGKTEYKDVFHAISSDSRSVLAAAVTQAYERALEAQAGKQGPCEPV